MIVDDADRRRPIFRDNLKKVPNIVYGLVIYGYKALTHVKLGDIEDGKELKRSIDALSWPGQGTAFEKGLTEAEELFENSKSQNSRKVVVLFTNSKTRADMATLEALAKRFGEKEIKLYVITVGDGIEDGQISVVTGNSNNVVKTTTTEEPTKVGNRLSGSTVTGNSFLVVCVHLS